MKKKICKKCNIYYDEEDIVCCECGTPLDYVEEGDNTPMSATRSSINKPNVAGANVQQDNRVHMHKGDDINVGGDNFNAQIVDKRTVTTTINNIQTIVDESKEVVKCEISGKRIHKIDSYECPVCKRIVAPDFYVTAKRMCIECAEKEEKKAAASATLLGNVRPQQIQAQPQPVQQPRPAQQEKIIPSIAPSDGNSQQVYIKPIRGGNGGGSHKGLITCLIIAAVVVGWYFWSRGNDAKEEIAEIVTNSVDAEKSTNTTAMTEEPRHTATASSSRQSSESGTSKKVESAPTETVKPETEKPKLSMYEQGAAAYEAKNYAQAAVFLKQALSEEKPQAAYYLAKLYQNGQGVSKSVKSAFNYMKQAADGGNSDAYYELAEMYRLGTGTEPNRALAKNWYEKAVISSAKNADKAANQLSKYN